MKGYKVHIWQSVSHNGKFSHHSQSYQTIHAYNEKEARSKIRELKPARRHELDNGVVFEVSKEFIYEVEYLGRVQRRTVYDYIK